MRVYALALTSVAITTGTAAADDRLLTDDTFALKPPSLLSFDGGISFGAPTALETGLSKGLVAGVAYGRTLALGARASYVSASEDGDAWAVTHREVRLLATAAIQRAIGRGTVGLRFGFGGTLVAEDRLRHQGERAGLMGDALEMTAKTFITTTTLEGVIALHVRGPWSFTLSGGPSASLLDGNVKGAWSGAIGIAWQP